jgi:transcriptional regulatory protein RtcR
VVFSVVGSKLDAPSGWRPTLQLVRHPAQLAVTELVLIEQSVTKKFTDALVNDVAEQAPSVRCVRETMPIEDPFSFEQVYLAFYEFCRRQVWDEHTDYFIHLTTGTHVMQIVWYLLVSEHFAPAKLVQTRPKTASRASGLDIVDLDLTAYPALARKKSQQRLAGQSLLKMGLTSKNAAYNQVIATLERAALGPMVPMLITGETGTGKSALARRVYELRRNARVLTGSLVEVNCATLHGTLRESALFGHKKGAFTGAERDRKGYLLAADGGMLFLDEVGELGLEEQALLLTAIEEGRYFPLGSDVQVHSRFALVCGTNRDLQRAVREGRFRDDLLARLAVWTFTLPPLRDRREDIEENLRYELEKFCSTYHRNARFTQRALKQYLSFAVSPHAQWTHNFRDLSQSVLRLAALAQDGVIDTDGVAAECASLTQSWSTRDRDDSRDGPSSRHPELDTEPSFDNDDRLDRWTREVIVQALSRSSSLAQAGRWLFDSKRSIGSNFSDRMRKLCARFNVDPSAFLLAR